MWKNGNSVRNQPSLGAGTSAGSAGTSKPDIDAYTFLRGVWNDYLQPTHVRMRAAAIGIEFERPRMAVSAVVNDQDFASLLDERIKNMERVNNEIGKVIEAKPVPQVEARPVKPHINDRRFRRM
jgi:hypothetical protein